MANNYVARGKHSCGPWRMIMWPEEKSPMSRLNVPYISAQHPFLVGSATLLVIMVIIFCFNLNAVRSDEAGKAATDYSGDVCS